MFMVSLELVVPLSGASLTRRCDRLALRKQVMTLS